MLAQIQKDQERIATHLHVVETEIEQAKHEHSEFEEKLRHAKTERSKAETSFTEAERAAQTTGEAMARIRVNAAQRIQELSSRRADFAAKSERRKGLQQDIRRLENESEELAKRSARFQLEAIEAQERVAIK